MSLPIEGYRLTGISAKAYEHPADRAATAALQAVPHLDTVVRKLIEFGYERALRRGVLGSAVRLGEDQLADVWRAHARAYETLDLEPVPDLYLTQFPIANALTVGAGKPIVVVNSELVQLLDAEQLRGVFAHEAGHVLSDHVLYRTALVILVRLSALPGIPLPLAPLRAALMEWFRAAELSCDRAAALVTRDPQAVCHTLMVIAAGAEAANLDLDVFMRQGQEYREKASPFDRFSRLLIDLGLTHPMSVQRVHELTQWVASGEYDRIVGGEYVTRDEPARPRAEA
ncbi:MAG TPA: M48 family metallopeptidase, partial [Solirubrobacteraceae bacterium]|nr:M48 family metallopeptidase [Solirubrobacteraceae bacterium]